MFIGRQHTRDFRNTVVTSLRALVNIMNSRIDMVSSGA